MIGIREILIGFLTSSSIMMIFSLFYAISKKGAPAAKPFVFICATVAIYLFGYAMEIASDTLEAMKAWNMVQYFGIPYISTFWLWFALEYNEVPWIRKPGYRHLLFILPTGVFIARLTNDFHSLYYTGMIFRSNIAFPVMVLEKGIIYYVMILYVSACLIVSNIAFIRTSRGSEGPKKQESRLLVFGSSLPWVAVILNGINFGNIGLDYSAIIYPVSCILIFMIVFQKQFLELKPKARDFVFDNTEDAFLVFDVRGKLADFNAAASRLFGGIRAGIDISASSRDIGIDSPLSKLAAIVSGEPPMQIPIASGGEIRHFHISASPVVDESGKHLGRVVALSDITQITRTLKDLAEKEKKLRTVTDSISEAFWLRNSSTGVYEYVSPAFEKIWGRPAEELYANPGVFLESVYAEDAEAVRAWLASDRNGASSDIECRIIRRGGEIRWVWIRSSPVFDGEGMPVQHAGIGVDITERKMMEDRIATGDRILDAINRSTAELLVAGSLAEAISGGLAMIGVATGVDRVSLVENESQDRSGCSIPALSQEWTSGRIPVRSDEADAGHPRPILAKPVADELASGRLFMTLVSDLRDEVFRKELESRSVRSVLLIPVFTNGNLWGHIGFEDCTRDRIWTDPETALLSTFAGAITKAIERRMYEREIEFISYHDSLTGLYNRAWFDYVMETTDFLDTQPLTLVMADVNGLKLTNDAFGHAAGDNLLCRAATLMKLECRPSDIIVRMGGDEFVIFLPGIDSKGASDFVGRIRKQAERYSTEIGMLSIAFGWETRVDTSRSLEEVLKAAEDAMYRQKLSESMSMKHSTISVILKTLYAKSVRERGHSERVASLAENFGKLLGLDEEKTRELYQAGLMHDIGKIGVADSILTKKEAPDEAEWVQLKRHSEIGYRILSLVNEYSRIASWVLSHHERWDGKGYPNGVAGAEIPLQARVLALADSWDAMIYDRPYQSAIPREAALGEIKAGSGRQFDPSLAELFLDMLRDSAGA